jgi:hypothetical protein
LLVTDTVGLFDTEIVGVTDALSEIVGVAVTDTVGLLEGEEPIDKDPEGDSVTVGLGELLEDTIGLFDTEIVGVTDALSEIVGVAVTDTVGLLEGEEPIDKDPEGDSVTVGLGELLEDTIGLFDTEIVGLFEGEELMIGVTDDVSETVGELLCELLGELLGVCDGVSEGEGVLLPVFEILGVLLDVGGTPITTLALVGNLKEEKDFLTKNDVFAHSEIVRLTLSNLDSSIVLVVLAHNADKASTVLLKQVEGAGDEQFISTATSVV